MQALTEMWRRSGIERGDIVLLHSSASRTCGEHGVSPWHILRSLEKAVGWSGTLILPTFNMGFGRGIPFGYHHTPSEMGAVTEVARTSMRYVRSGHPMFSVCSLGPQMYRFAANNFSAFGENSPFGVLLEMGGKIAALDVAIANCLTFTHHVEEMEWATHRTHKTFRGGYRDQYGVESVREYSVYVRRPGVKTDVRFLENALWVHGIARGDRPFEGSGLCVMDSRLVYGTVKDILETRGPYGTLCVEES